MKKWLIWILRLILAGVFIYAGGEKILNPAEFASSIDNYRLLPWFLTSLVAVILPWVEVFCGVLLLWGKWLRGASFIMIAMDLVFIFAIASALIRGLDIDCGCFSTSTSGSHVSVVRIVEDFVLLLFAMVIYWNELKNEG